MINIIIPVYNCSKTLGRTLASLVAQTDQSFEVVIVDDCSSENIKTIVDDYNSKLNIKYIRNEVNMGCGMSRQVGIDNSHQQFFCFLDSDDVFMPYTVETFNSIIAANPDTELIHSYFYEQTMIDGNPALILRKDGFVWCHGKLYNRDLINKYGIKNSPLVRWSDDSYFNSMCTELMEMHLVPLPMYLWCNNINSVIRRKDEERDRLVSSDFLNAMKMSIDFVLQYKDNVSHLKETIKRLKTKEIMKYYTEEEIQTIDELSKYLKE